VKTHYYELSDEALVRESILQGQRVQASLNDEERGEEEHRLFVIEAMLDYRIALAKRMSERADQEREDQEPQEAKKILRPRRTGFPRAKYTKQLRKTA
jgi:hypothetical protein